MDLRNGVRLLLGLLLYGVVISGKLIILKMFHFNYIARYFEEKNHIKIVRQIKEFKCCKILLTMVNILSIAINSIMQHNFYG